MERKLDAGCLKNNVLLLDQDYFLKPSSKTAEFASLHPEKETADAMKRKMNAYYKELSRHLTCPQKERRKFLQEARRMVADLMAENPNADFSDIKSFLGEPEDLADSMLDRLDFTMIARYQKSRNRIRKAILFCFLIFSISLSTLTYYVFHLKSEVIFTQEQIIIIENGD